MPLTWADRETRLGTPQRRRCLPSSVWTPAVNRGLVWEAPGYQACLEDSPVHQLHQDQRSCPHLPQQVHALTNHLHIQMECSFNMNTIHGDFWLEVFKWRKKKKAFSCRSKTVITYSSRKANAWLFQVRRAKFLCTDNSWWKSEWLRRKRCVSGKP